MKYLRKNDQFYSWGLIVDEIKSCWQIFPKECSGNIFDKENAKSTFEKIGYFLISHTFWKPFYTIRLFYQFKCNQIENKQTSKIGGGERRGTKERLRKNFYK